MKMYQKLLMSVLFSTALVGCSTLSGEDSSGNMGTGVQGTDTTEGVSTTGIGSGDVFTGSPLDDPASPLSKKVIYFAFDSSEIAPEYEAVLAAHGAYLASKPNTSIILEGHADERGTREYNIALSERRANGVKNILLLQGVGENQLEVVGYGEEKPVALGHDDQSWQLNRRVELVYPAN